MLEKLKAAKILPVRVLNPSLDRFFVGQVVHVLQIMQTHHQPRRLRRAANRLVMLAKGFIELRPRHQASQADKRMFHIDDRIQPLAEKIGVTVMVLRRFQENLPENDSDGVPSWHFPIFETRRESLFVNGLQFFQGELCSSQCNSWS